ncbi:MAG: DUF4097 family beta strand repeat-containing protein [Aeromicrobium sp.]|uniref:DUF4097 family beta strand repeat-containing protein n=1 Tax=Aeromicrobium sp. TaxID=1871063 RepID=UPI0039E6B74B
MTDPAGEDFDDEFDEDDERSPLARTLIQVAATIVAVGVIAVLVLGVGRLTRSESTTDPVSFSVDPAVPLILVVEGLDVSVVPADGPDITVEASLVGGWLDTGFTTAQERGEIRLAASCQAWLIPGCGGSVKIGMPVGAQFELSADDGDVDLAGIDGVATVHTSSGDVHADDLSVVEVGVTTGSGDVHLAFAAQPFVVKATSESGDLTVELPSGEVAYDVVTESESGDVSGDTASAGEDAEGLIVLETRSGDVDLAGR